MESTTASFKLSHDQIPNADTRLVLANTLSVSPVALGTWSWGDTKTWNWTADSDAKAQEAFGATVEAGINFFDTAEVYGAGESERCLERYSKALQPAQKVVLATKFLPFPWKFSYPSSLLNALRASLERLQVDCVDLYQIHGHIHLRSIEVVADALAEAVRLGLTKTVGVSNYSTAALIRIHGYLKEKHGIQLASNQIEFNLLRRIPESSGLIAACHERGVAVLAYSPLAMGRLTGKYSAANPPPSGRRFSDVNMQTVEPLLAVMKSIAEERKTSISSVALNYVMVKGCIPLAGAKDKHQATQNAQALGWRLTDEEVVRLEEHSQQGSNGWLWQHG